MTNQMSVSQTRHDQNEKEWLPVGPKKVVASEGLERSDCTEVSNSEAECYSDSLSASDADEVYYESRDKDHHCSQLKPSRTGSSVAKVQWLKWVVVSVVASLTIAIGVALTLVFVFCSSVASDSNTTVVPGGGDLPPGQHTHGGGGASPDSTHGTSSTSAFSSAASTSTSSSSRANAAGSTTSSTSSTTSSTFSATATCAAAGKKVQCEKAKDPNQVPICVWEANACSPARTLGGTRSSAGPPHQTNFLSLPDNKDLVLGRDEDVCGACQNNPCHGLSKTDCEKQDDTKKCEWRVIQENDEYCTSTSSPPQSSQNVLKSVLWSAFGSFVLFDLIRRVRYPHSRERWWSPVDWVLKIWRHVRAGSAPDYSGPDYSDRTRVEFPGYHHEGDDSVNQYELLQRMRDGWVYDETERSTVFSELMQALYRSNQKYFGDDPYLIRNFLELLNNKLHTLHYDEEGDEEGGEAKKVFEVLHLLAQAEKTLCKKLVGPPFLFTHQAHDDPEVHSLLQGAMATLGMATKTLEQEEVEPQQNSDTMDIILQKYEPVRLHYLTKVRLHSESDLVEPKMQSTYDLLFDSKYALARRFSNDPNFTTLDITGTQEGSMHKLGQDGVTFQDLINDCLSLFNKVAMLRTADFTEQGLSREDYVDVLAQRHDELTGDLERHVVNLYHHLPPVEEGLQVHQFNFLKSTSVNLHKLANTVIHDVEGRLIDVRWRLLNPDVPVSAPSMGDLPPAPAPSVEGFVNMATIMAPAPAPGPMEPKD